MKEIWQGVNDSLLTLMMVDATSDAFNTLATTKELPKFDGKLLRLAR